MNFKEKRRDSVFCSVLGTLGTCPTNGLQKIPFLCKSILLNMKLWVFRFGAHGPYIMKYWVSIFEFRGL